MRGSLSDAAAVGAGHTAVSSLAWYAADRATAERHNEAAIAILSETDDARSLGFALANHAFLAAQRGAVTEARDVGLRAQRIADSLDGDPILHGFATIGVGVARLMEGVSRAGRISWPPATRACANATTTSPPPR